jgi:ketosteroid isomerase-like protein
MMPVCQARDTAGAMSRTDIDVVRSSFEAFNARDADRLISLSAEDCEWVTFRAQLEGSAYRGHEGIREFLSDMAEDWEELRVHPLEFHYRSPRVVVVGRLRALGRGSSVDIETLAGFVFELSGGRITRVTSYSSPETALEAVDAD